jgi:hypothetical protein
MSCILTRYTYDKNLEIIQPLVQEFQHFMCFQFWPPGGQPKNQIGPKFGFEQSFHLGVHVYKVSGQLPQQLRNVPR